MAAIKERFDGFRAFVWNSEEKKVLGRDGKSWAEIGAFYLVYYICLAGFFVGMLAVFYQTMDMQRPRLTGDSSLLKGNPGMGFQPMPDVEYTLIRFKKEPKSYTPHVKAIRKILEVYNTTTTGVDCTPPGFEPAEDEACEVNYSKLTAGCNEDNDFGYGLDPPRPCVLLRLNKIFDWMPQEYTEDSMGSAIEEDVKEKILKDPKMIYIQCVGENPADRDNLGTNITYYPTQGYPHYYYPYRNQKGYLAPLVFVQFNSVVQNVALMVECRALAPNIRYDRQEKEGGVHFELLNDY
ncbi:hypothetical protein BaRGS_00038324 [Batillaria attramentaria]|uniref:Sodium/potassium-transporting ATPase subunit beta n=1 Tax=Batillaria attramentaria TaxID=370345 RepID=A0ABD0J768_9CAEN